MILQSLQHDVHITHVHDTALEMNEIKNGQKIHNQCGKSIYSNF